MKNIIEARNLPVEEKVYLKKGKFGWRVVNPIRDPETNKFNWSSFFDVRGFITLAIILAIIGLAWLGFHEQIANFQEVMRNPCAYCKDCQSYALNFASNIKAETINWTLPDLT